MDEPGASERSNGAGADRLAAPGPGRPEVGFEIVSAAAVDGAATPTLRFRAAVTEPVGIDVYTIALTALFTIEPGRRSYGEEERERLVELFGEPERWSSTTGGLRWAQADVLVPSFTGGVSFDIDVGCTYDHEIAATKYFGGLSGGAIPLHVHFNGTLFYRGEDGRLQMTLLPWDLSERFELPVDTWRSMMDRHYPRGSWVRLDHGTLDRLREVKTSRGLATYDDAVAALFDGEAGDADA